MPLDTRDDCIHPIGQEPTWREAFYFDFFDPQTRLCAFGYSGVHPNQQIGDVIFALWRDGTLLASFTRWDFNIPQDIGEERYGFGPLRFRPLEPFKSWQMYYGDGRCTVDVTFEAIHPPYDWADSQDALSQTHSHHYEQQGRYTGTVQIGGKTYSVRAVGARDHAWGWGARAGIQRWIWASAQFSERLAWNTFQVALGDGRDILYGYLFRGHRNELIRASQLKAAYDEKSDSPLRFEVEIEGREQDRVRATARVINAFSTSFQERNKTGHHFFCFTEYECEGQVGYGQSNFHWHKQADRPEDWAVRV